MCWIVAASDESGRYVHSEEADSRLNGRDMVDGYPLPDLYLTISIAGLNDI